MGRHVSHACDQPVRMDLPALLRGFPPGLDIGARLSRDNGCNRSAIKGSVASGVERISAHHSPIHREDLWVVQAMSHKQNDNALRRVYAL